MYCVSQYIKCINMNFTYITVCYTTLKYRCQFSIKLLCLYCHRVRKEEIFVCVLKENLTDLHTSLYIAIYQCIVIFLGQCIDTFKSCIVPSLVIYALEHTLLQLFRNVSWLTKSLTAWAHTISGRCWFNGLYQITCSCTSKILIWYYGIAHMHDTRTHPHAHTNIAHTPTKFN